MLFSAAVVAVAVSMLITNAKFKLAGRRTGRARVNSRFARVYVKNVLRKMYHDPLNTQIMIAIERFHLFSPAASKKKKAAKTPAATIQQQQQQLCVTINIALQLQCYDQIMIIRACVYKELRKYQKVNHSKSVAQQQANIYFFSATKTKTRACAHSFAHSFARMFFLCTKIQTNMASHKLAHFDPVHTICNRCAMPSL